jgi:hypothetical protein
VTALELEQSSSAPPPDGLAEPGNDLAAFLGTLAAILRETISKFEQAASTVTDLIVTQPGQTDRELVVALQSFDRINQEFSAICDALARTGTSATGTWTQNDGEDHPQHKVIGAISIAELRDRMLNQLTGAPLEPTLDSLLEAPLPATDDENVAEF